MSDRSYESGAAVQTTLKIAPKFLVKARCCNILCRYFMLQIPVIIKHTSVLLICLFYCCLLSFSLINGSSDVGENTSSSSAKEMVSVECTNSADFRGVMCFKW